MTSKKRNKNNLIFGESNYVNLDGEKSFSPAKKGCPVSTGIEMVLKKQSFLEPQKFQRYF